ncbi:hypothetical protein ADK56_24610 [Streptomyces sp. MMG1522]|nr:hypothetical protein ADK56_24610 [Streptomyces sp. MMG1522]
MLRALLRRRRIEPGPRAATRWLRAGVDEDVVQMLLGHQSSRSMEPYRPTSDQDKRDAIEKVAAMRETHS